MTWRGLHMKKRISSGLASRMFTMGHISIIFYCSLCIHKLGDPLLHLCLSSIRCISAEILYICQLVGIYIGKWLPNQVTTNNIASYVGLPEIGSSCEISSSAISWDGQYRPRISHSWKSNIQELFQVYHRLIRIEYLFTLVLCTPVYATIANAQVYRFIFTYTGPT